MKIEKIWPKIILKTTKIIPWSRPIGSCKSWLFGSKSSPSTSTLGQAASCCCRWPGSSNWGISWMEITTSRTPPSLSCWSCRSVSSTICLSRLSICWSCCQTFWTTTPGGCAAACDGWWIALKRNNTCKLIWKLFAIQLLCRALLLLMSCWFWVWDLSSNSLPTMYYSNLIVPDQTTKKNIPMYAKTSIGDAAVTLVAVSAVNSGVWGVIFLKEVAPHFSRDTRPEVANPTCIVVSGCFHSLHNTTGVLLLKL